jgi:glycosyltransferase 2 family protein
MKIVLKFGISIVLLYVIFRVINISTLLNILSEIKYPYLLLAIIFQFLSNLVASCRWYLIMKLLKFNEQLSFFIKSYFKGTFFNQALPSSIGGDAIRVLELGNKGYSKKEAFYGIFIDRIIGLQGLLILNLTANSLNSNLLPNWLFNLITMICVGSILGMFLLVLLRKISQLENIPILSLAYHLSNRFRNVYNNIQNISIQTSLSLLIHLLSIMSIYIISIALGMEYSLGVFMVIFPPVFLLTLIPISLAGWGVREGAMIGLFMLIGASKESVLSLSLLYGFIVILCSLPGMFFWLTAKAPSRKEI